MELIMRLANTESDQATYADLVQFLQRAEKRGNDRAQLLAIAANLVGKLVAMQDQRKYTLDQIMELVWRNLQVGNREAVAELLNAPGGNA